MSEKEEELNNLADLLKLPPKIMTGLAIASGIILFSSDSIINMLYMGEFKNQYGFAIGVTFVVSISILACYLTVIIFKYLYSIYSDKKFSKNMDKFMEKLGHEEKNIIREMMNSPSYTLRLPMQNGVVINLKYYGLIQPAGAQHAVNMQNPIIPYFLQRWVIDRVNENPSLLD